MADFDLTALRPGTGENSIAATCVAMVEQAMSDAAVERGWKMASDANSLKQFFELKELPAIGAGTWAQAFDDAADSAAIFGSAELAAALNGYTDWLKPIADAGSQAPNFMEPQIALLDNSSAASRGTSADFAVYASGNSSSFEWSPDGAHVLFNNGNSVHLANVSTPGDPSTIQAPANLSVGVLPNYSTDIGSASITSDGVNLYVTYQDTGGVQTIARLTLTTPWDITTAVLAETAGIVTSTNYDDTVVKVSPDGTKLNVLSFHLNSSWVGRYYDMSGAPNDIASASSTVLNSSTGILSGIQSWSWSPDGRRFIVDGWSSILTELKVADPWNLSTLLEGLSYNDGGTNVLWGSASLGSNRTQGFQASYDPLDDTKILAIEGGTGGNFAQGEWVEFTMGKWF